MGIVAGGIVLYLGVSRSRRGLRELFPLGHAGVYRYMEDLLTLDRCRLSSGSSRLPLGFESVTTPLVWREWDRCLVNHPDQRFRRYIVGWIQSGFRVRGQSVEGARSFRTVGSAGGRSQIGGAGGLPSSVSSWIRWLWSFVSPSGSFASFKSWFRRGRGGFLACSRNWSRWWANWLTRARRCSRGKCSSATCLSCFLGFGSRTITSG